MRRYLIYIGIFNELNHIDKNMLRVEVQERLVLAKAYCPDVRSVEGRFRKISVTDFYRNTQLRTKMTHYSYKNPTQILAKVYL